MSFPWHLVHWYQEFPEFHLLYLSDGQQFGNVRNMSATAQPAKQQQQPARINEKQRHDLVTRLNKLGCHTDEDKSYWLKNAGVDVDDLTRITVLDFQHHIVPALVKQEQSRE